MTLSEQVDSAMKSSVLKYLAEHKIILWCLLLGGILNLVQCTVFYAQVVQFWREVFVFLMEEESIEDCPPIIQFCDRTLNNSWNRFFTIAFGLSLIACALVGLIRL